MSGLRDAYARRYHDVLGHIASAIESQLRDYFASEPRIDRVTARAKSIERFLEKAAKVEGGVPKYTEPLHQIQDQVGARIITFYLSDIERVSTVVERYYKPIESQTLIPDSEWEFGYFGRHYVLLVPSDVIEPTMDTALIPDFFELQVKTLFQHAWSEANHDLGYKPGERLLRPDQLRRLAFASAQAWGADRVFEELFQELDGDRRTLINAVSRGK